MAERQKAIIVGVHYDQKEDFSNSMEELAQLAEACDIEVVGEVTQKLDRVHSAHYIGKGKLQELTALLAEKDVQTVLFNDELSPSQVRNLEEATNCKIIDRTVLILDIFAQRAKTKEAMLQVEIAKLQYMLPRLAGLGESLGRQGGGSGLINRGSGETKLELDRRRIEDRISRLHKELDTLVVQRKNQRKMRKKKEMPSIALVGYTNAGKSTLMNVLIEKFHAATEKKVFEKNMLFATLETSVRNITLPNNKSFLLTDTVGFISKLPHQLVKAFRSTLEEVAEADLLIHVVDFSNPNYKEQINVTKQTLKELGAENIPTIYAFNKVDLVMEEVSMAGTDTVYLSAKKQMGIDELIGVITENVFKQYISCEMNIPYDKGNILSYLKERANILSTEYKNEGVYLSIECKEEDYNRYREYVM
ncbi:GTPase HflX [Cytobacillus oceanisediminis]|uniref:GTPase HflX n=1 Tax=Niallia alba TaxID=2729105 RepID=A0A7Y0K4Q7_9BACI|nr:MULTISPECIES: GTPase HflX [Bacillaceae]MBZ9533746.1 GTPase HflX [Cytobacillus oceanisediminis]NMO75747.1 GTPase HflX [Niallia alba]